MTATANIDWASPNLRFVDLDGDGLADVLVTEDEVFTWYPWLAGEGFGPPATVPQAVRRGPGPGSGAGRRHRVDLPGRHERRRARPTWSGSATARSATGRTSATAGSAPRSPWTTPPCSTTPTGSTSAACGSPTSTAPAPPTWSTSGRAAPRSGSTSPATPGRRAATLPQFPPSDAVARRSRVFDLLGTGTACAGVDLAAARRRAAAAALHRPDRRRQAVPADHRHQQPRRADHTDVRAVDEVLPAGPRRRPPVAHPAAVPRARRGAASTTDEAISRTSLVTTLQLPPRLLRRRSSASSAASPASTSSTPTSCPPRPGPARSPRPRRRHGDEFDAAAGADPHLVPHRRLLRRRGHRRPPGRRVLPARPAGPALGRHGPARRGQQRRGVPRGLPGAARAGSCARRSTPTTGHRPAANPYTHSEHRYQVDPPAARRLAPSYGGVSRLGAGVAQLPLRAQPRRPADQPRADPRDRRLRQRHQQRHGRLPAPRTRVRRTGGNAGHATARPTSPTSPTSPTGTGSACPSRPAPTSSPACAPTRPSGRFDPASLLSAAAGGRDRHPLRAGAHRDQPAAAAAQPQRTIYRRDDLSGPLPARPDRIARAWSTPPTSSSTHPGCSARSTAPRLTACAGSTSHRRPGRARSTSTATATVGALGAALLLARPRQPRPGVRAPSTSTCRRARRPLGQHVHASPTTTTPARQPDHRRRRQHHPRARTTTACWRRG